MWEAKNATVEQLTIKANEEMRFIERQKRDIEINLVETRPFVAKAKRAIGSLRLDI